MKKQSQYGRQSKRNVHKYALISFSTKNLIPYYFTQRVYVLCILNDYATVAYWENVPLPTFLQNSYTIHCSKTLTTFIHFHSNYDYRGRLLINKDLFLCGSLHNTVS